MERMSKMDLDSYERYLRHREREVTLLLEKRIQFFQLRLVIIATARAAVQSIPPMTNGLLGAQEACGMASDARSASISLAQLNGSE